MRSRTRILLLVASCALTSACSLFAAKKKDPPAPPAKPKPVHEQQTGTSVWGDRVGSSAYQADHAAIDKTGISSHSDRIGAGQIDQLKRAGPGSTPKIAAYLLDPGPQVRARAVEVLTEFGPKAEPALPKVAEVLRHVEPQFRLGAAQAMAGIRSPRSENTLEAALKDRSPAVRAWAHAGLSRIGGDCEDHQQAIASILAGNLGQTAVQASKALAGMKCASTKAIDTLIKALDSSDELSRAASASALGHMGPVAARCVPKLVELLAARKAFRARIQAMLALARMGPAAKEAIDPLITALGDPAPKFRELAAHALGAIGPTAERAIGPLTKATRDQEGTVQSAAKKALARISSRNTAEQEQTP